MRFEKKYWVIALCSSLGACSRGGDSRFKEKAQIEAQTTAQNQITAENKNLSDRASAMEADLERRARFHQALTGIFEGSLVTEQGTFQLRVTLVPSLTPVKRTRTRTLEEVASDLNNLNFRAQIIQWNPQNRLSSSGCRVESIRPDYERGELKIVSENCPNVYFISLGQQGESSQLAPAPAYQAATAGDSALLANQLMDGQGPTINTLVGFVQPTTNASTYYFNLGRVTR